jgi:hypothetical protein
MPKQFLLFISAALVLAFLNSGAQTTQATFAFDVSGGISRSYFSKAPNALADHLQMGLGKGFQVSAERIFKGKFGLGFQIEHTQTDFSNRSLASDMSRRLYSTPRMEGLSVSESFAMNQTTYQLCSSLLQQKNHWQFECKLSAGLGLTAYGITGSGFVADSSQAIFLITPAGTKYFFSINCKPYLSVQPQFILRYLFHSNQRRSIALFASLSYSYQKLEFEYLEQHYQSGTAIKQTNHYETLLVWRQNLQYLGFRAGISIILNKKLP